MKGLLPLGGRTSVRTQTLGDIAQAWSYILLLPAQVTLIYLYKVGADRGEGEGYLSPGICLEVLEINLFLTNHNTAFCFEVLFSG